MLRLAATGGDAVDVEIGDFARYESQIGQTRLLSTFTQGGSTRVLPRFEMTSHLQPAIQSAMVMQQQVAQPIDDETARRDVTRHELVSRIGFHGPSEQMQKCGLMLRFKVVERLVRRDDQVEGNHW